MRQIKTVSICFSFLSLLLFSCTSTKESRPLWADDTTVNSVYPSSEYIARIATSSIESSSAALAESELGKYFSHQVTSETKAYQRISNDAANTTDDRELVRTVSINSSFKLFAVSHTTPWFDKSAKRYVCCAYIKRDEAWKVYEPVVLQAQKKYLASYNAAVSESDPLKQIALLAKCDAPAETYVDTLDLAHALYAEGAAPYEADRNTIASLNEKATAAKLAATMRVVVKNDKDGRIARILSSLLSQQGYVLSSSSFAYVVSAEVQQNKKKFEDSITAYPDITVAINNGAETLFNYSKNFDRVSGFAEAEALVDSRIYSAIEKELNSSFIPEFQSSLQ